MYKIEMNHEKKQFVITLKGSLDSNESIAYLQEYESYVANNNFEDYYLMVDTSELKVSSQDMEENIKKSMALNFTTPFKARFNIPPKSAVTNMQANRVGNEFNLKNEFIIVQSIEEFLAQIK